MKEPIQGVRLDSGDLAALSKEVRRILDEAGKPDVKIVASSDLNEYRIEQLLREGAAIDIFGVGTEMVTSRDDPALGGVYKLVELSEGGQVEAKVKLSLEKETFPGCKQIFRASDSAGKYSGDVIGKADEALPGRPLLAPVMKNGEVLRPHPPLAEVQRRAKENRERLAPEVRKLRGPAIYPVQQSRYLQDLAEGLRRQIIQG
jgi:nicotinate phosphoribosyltransferase